MPMGAWGQSAIIWAKFWAISSLTWVSISTRVSPKVLTAERTNSAMTRDLPVPVGMATRGSPSLAWK
jgi:hypothetical protein